MTRLGLVIKYRYRGHKKMKVEESGKMTETVRQFEDKFNEASVKDIRESFQ